MKKIYLQNFILEILQKNSGSIVLMLYTNILENDRLFLEYSCIFFRDMFHGGTVKCFDKSIDSFHQTVTNMMQLVKQSDKWFQNQMFGQNELIVNFKDYLDIKRKERLQVQRRHIWKWRIWFNVFISLFSWETEQKTNIRIIFCKAKKTVSWKEKHIPYPKISQKLYQIYPDNFRNFHQIFTGIFFQKFWNPSGMEFFAMLKNNTFVWFVKFRKHLDWAVKRKYAKTFFVVKINEWGKLEIILFFPC